MSIIETQTIDINQQRAKVFGQHPELKLVAPCKLDDGVLGYDEVQKELLIEKFENSKIQATFFIPASGSGSRMFQFLYDFLEEPTEQNTSQVEQFLNNIEKFAFYYQLPIDFRMKIHQQELSLEEIVRYLLTNEGMSYGDLPKGLIPFHKNGPFVLTPFQEQLLQGLTIKEGGVNFHYTIKPEFETKINKVINVVRDFIGQQVDVTYSIQNPDLDSVAFDGDKEVVLNESGDVLTRPSGHGALIQNLNNIDSDLIFIKNIDNVQQYAKSHETSETWKYLGGMALWFQEKMAKLMKNPTHDSFVKFNNRFQLLTKEQAESISEEEIVALLNRPFRICGMVRNEGQPGGGPFWVEEEGIITKQIVEKAQINTKGSQFRLMIQSSYFNPVVMVAVTKDIQGGKFDLKEFVDESKYFVVKKSYKGQPIYFSELPGLWNGSMANWNTIFVEIPAQAFTPVKTVLDLLAEPHKEI